MAPGDVAVKSRVNPNPMIVRLSNHNTKMRVMKARKELKGKGVSIAEDLCRDLMGVYNRVKRDDGVQDVWAWNGQVCCKVDGRIYNVLYGQSLNDIVPHFAKQENNDLHDDENDTEDPEGATGEDEQAK